MLGTASTARASRKPSWPTTNTSIEPAHCANFFHCPPLAPTARSEGSLVGVCATVASQSRAAHRKAQVPGGYPVWAVGVIVFIKSKIACAVPSDSRPRNLTLCVRRRATGKGKGCVLSSTKISLLFRTTAIFYEKTFLFFDLAKGETKTRGLFLDQPLVSLIALVLFVSSSPCFAHSSSTSLLGAPSRMTHARVSTHPRLAHSASFHFFAFTPHLQPTELLLVRGEGFCISTIYIPEGEGSSPKPSPTKCCCSTICTHRVKR